MRQARSWLFLVGRYGFDVSDICHSRGADLFDPVLSLYNLLTQSRSNPASQIGYGDPSLGEGEITVPKRETTAFTEQPRWRHIAVPS